MKMKYNIIITDKPLASCFSYTMLSTYFDDDVSRLSKKKKQKLYNFNDKKKK